MNLSAHRLPDSVLALSEPFQRVLKHLLVEADRLQVLLLLVRRIRATLLPDQC